jgi:hypothetical protein
VLASDGVPSHSILSRRLALFFSEKLKNPSSARTSRAISVRGRDERPRGCRLTASDIFFPGFHRRVTHPSSSSDRISMRPRREQIRKIGITGGTCLRIVGA